MNVALTRAKAGVIVVGHSGTLVGRGHGEVDESRAVWRRLLGGLVVVEIDDGKGGKEKKTG